jgi:hypothetical protein
MYECIPVTGVVTSKLPFSLGNRLTHGGEVVKLMHRPPFVPRRLLIPFYIRVNLCIIFSFSNCNNKFIIAIKIMEEQNRLWITSNFRQFRVNIVMRYLAVKLLQNIRCVAHTCTNIFKFLQGKAVHVLK